MSIHVDGVPKHLAVAGPTRGLMQYLLSFPERSLRREMLAEMFWPQTPLERRRSTFNTALSRIRRALLPTGELAIEADADQVGLHVGAGARIDACNLVSAVHAICRHGRNDAESYRALADALDACEAPYLDGVDDHWAVVERERLTIIQLRGRGLMMRALAEECRYEEALDYGRSILAIDPFRESTLREVMWLHVLNGERPRALRLFQEFRASLFEEMGISPTTDTHALREHIAQDSVDTTVWPGLGPDGPVRDSKASGISSYLQDRLSRIQESRVEVYRSLQATRI